VRRFAVLCGLFLLVRGSIAQGVDAPKTISEPDARQHLVQHAEPVYPAIAQAVRLQGEVTLAVTIDARGLVAAEKVVNGPPMLQQAALDAVKKWQFAPFIDNGAAIPVATTLIIEFKLAQNGPGPTAEQEKAAQDWFPLEEKCMSAVKAQAVQEAVEICKQTLDMSLKAGDLTLSNQLARTGSYQLYGHALLLADKKQAALAQEYMAVDEAHKCLTNKDQEFAMPYFWRGVVEANMGQNDAALADFATAEATNRKAIANLPDMKEKYSQVLAAILKEHAALLDRMGRADDAAKVRAEAAAL
jgi:TonB family protein